MISDDLPTGHIVGRRLVIVVIAVAVVIALIWFYVTKIETGDVASWYHEFRYEQDGLFPKLFYATKFPWEYGWRYPWE